MQALRDTILVAHVSLTQVLDIPEDDSAEYETDPEDFEDIETPPREFPAQNVPCPLVGRLQTMAVKVLPPPPPRWMRILFVIWIAWCGVTKSAAPWVVGHGRIQAASEALLRLSA